MNQEIEDDPDVDALRLARQEVDRLRQRSRTARLYIEQMYRIGKLEGRDYHALMARLYDGADKM